MPVPTRQERRFFLFVLVAAAAITFAQLNLAQLLHVRQGKSLVPDIDWRETFVSSASNIDSTNSAPAEKPKRLPHSTNTNKNAVQVRPQNVNGGAFVHMGKTGGSTLSILLKNGCHSFMAHPCRNISTAIETPASRLIQSYYHVPDFGLLPQSNHDFYLVTARDPLDRTVSAFCHEHIRNRDARNETAVGPFLRWKYDEAYACFPTLESFVSHLNGHDSVHFHYPYHKREIHARPCQDFARAAFHGSVKLFNLFYFNYQRIQSFLEQVQLRKNLTIYVARQEKLWDDWKEINNRWLAVETATKTFGLNKSPQPPTENRRNTTDLELLNKLPVTRDLTPAGVESLCQALQSEYKAYFWLLKQARNLHRSSPSDWDFSLIRAKERCGAHLDVDALAA
jgi:hypothetical protein